MIQNGNLNFLQLTFFKKMEVTFTQAGRYVHWLHERKQHVSWWCDANEKACAQAIFLLQWRCQALVPQHVRIASFTFFIASLLLYWLYWRMNPWTRACPSVSLLFKVTFDHPTLKLWDLKWGGPQKMYVTFCHPSPHLFFGTVACLLSQSFLGMLWLLHLYSPVQRQILGRGPSLTVVLEIL